MASASLTFDQLGGYFANLGGSLSRLEFSRPLRSIALYFNSEARKCFAEGRTPDGDPWKALKNPSKRRGGASAKPLRDTGLLMGSVFGRVASSSAIVSESAVIQGASADYASFHQFGTRTIPARPFLGITPAMQERAVMILLDYAEQFVREAAQPIQRAA